MLPLGEYRWGGGIWFRLPAGEVRRSSDPSNRFRLYAACPECDGPPDIYDRAPRALWPFPPFQVFVTWDDADGIMCSFGNPRTHRGPWCGYEGRLSLAEQSARGSLQPWVEGARRIHALGPNSQYWTSHYEHLFAHPQGPGREPGTDRQQRGRMEP